MARCQSAVAEANRKAGGATVYLPTLGVTGEELAKRVEFLRQIGCRGATVLPVYQGFDTIRSLAAGSDLVLLGHPSGSGVYFHDRSGITAEVLLGQIYRLAGCDVVNFPRAGGRFPVTPSTEEGIVQRLREPMGSMPPTLAAPGGSVDLETLAPWLERYGTDTVFVVGASLLRGARVREAAQQIAGAIQRL